MKPVDQDRFGTPYGNCTAACIASLIGEPLHAVPNFNLWDGVFGNWEIGASAWLAGRGWELGPAFLLSFVEDCGSRIVAEGEHVMAGGVNPDGVKHMVIFLDGELAHDPNPSRAGLREGAEFLMTLRKVEPVAKALFAMAE